MESAVAAYHPEDRPIVEAALKSSLENKTDFQFSLRIIRPSGEIRNVFSQGHCELNDKDDITKLFGIFQDITEQKELEIALLKSQARLQDFADVSSNWFWELDAELDFLILEINLRVSRVSPLKNCWERPSNRLGLLDLIQPPINSYFPISMSIENLRILCIIEQTRMEK